MQNIYFSLSFYHHIKWMLFLTSLHFLLFCFSSWYRTYFVPPLLLILLHNLFSVSSILSGIDNFNILSLLMCGISYLMLFDSNLTASLTVRYFLRTRWQFKILPFSDFILFPIWMQIRGVVYINVSLIINFLLLLVVVIRVSTLCQ